MAFSASDLLWYVTKAKPRDWNVAWSFAMKTRARRPNCPKRSWRSPSLQSSDRLVIRREASCCWLKSAPLPPALPPSLPRRLGGTYLVPPAPAAAAAASAGLSPPSAGLSSGPAPVPARSRSSCFSRFISVQTFFSLVICSASFRLSSWNLSSPSSLTTASPGSLVTSIVTASWDTTMWAFSELGSSFGLPNFSSVCLARMLLLVQFCTVRALIFFVTLYVFPSRSVYSTRVLTPCSSTTESKTVFPFVPWSKPPSSSSSASAHLPPKRALDIPA
mmetsp:Transcript_42413/g.110410  ORF Transcript_42413/g.110410 Transcript_42413/m.110410 type:complete len:275 (+) Transcript_42413:191-1015(+)